MMSAIARPVPEVGSPAPPLRLPSAQGPDIGLADYAGRRHVIVWFTKGLACPFCRRQTSQLARARAQIQGLDAEVLQVTPTRPERARLFARRFVLPFPYLCDPTRSVAPAWGLAWRPHSPARFLRRIDLPRGPGAFGRDAFGPVAALPGEWDELLVDDDTGFFIVDRTGIVRFRHAGPYSRAWSIPTNEAILAELRGLG